MPKIAVDIALLPPESILDVCIEINKKGGKKMIVNLNKKDNLPHITLAMGVMDEKDLPVASENLQQISKNFFPLNLELTKFYCKKYPLDFVGYRESYGFEVGRTDELFNLHQTVMSGLFSIFSYDVTLDMFYKESNEEIKEVSKFWVKNYAVNRTNPDNYHPHISLKSIKPEYNGELPLKFTASRLALCHLGDTCSCRKILWEGKLSIGK